MNFRSTYLLLGLVLVALGGLAIYILVSGDGGKTGVGEGYLLQGMKAVGTKPADIDRVEIEANGTTLTFTREGNAWAINAPTKARADSAAIEAIVNALLNARLDKTTDPGKNLATLGLDKPSVKVTLHTPKTSEWVALGNVTIGDDKAQVFVVTSDKPDKAKSVNKSTFTPLFKSELPKGATTASDMVKSVTDFRSLAMLGDGLVDPATQVKSLRILRDKDELALFQTPGIGWRFRIPADFGDVAVEGDPTPPKDGREPSINNVRTLLNLLVAIKPGDTRQIIESPKALTTYGLDPGKDKPLQIDIVRDDGKQETLYVGHAVPTPEPKKDAKKDEPKAEPVDRYYARHASDSVVMEVNAMAVRALDRLMKTKNTLRDKTLLRAAPTLIDAVDITSNGETFELRKVGGFWKIYDTAGKERPARTGAVLELVNRLTTRQVVTGFPEAQLPDDKKGFANTAVEVKLWENGIVKDDKADPTAKPKVAAIPTARVQFGFKDVGDVVFARRSIGEVKNDFYLPVDIFNLASRIRTEYIDVQLKPFASDSILKLEFTHGKETFTLERPDDKKPATQTTWKILTPERLKDRPADAFKIFDLLNQLSFMRPAKLTVDRPQEKHLNTFRVNPAEPLLKVVVRTTDSADRTFYFGDFVGTDKKFAYMKPSEEDVIVEVERNVVDAFARADVQDTVVHKIDKVKIKSVKITGWQELLAKPTTLDIVRKDGKWTLSDASFPLDDAKVNLLLDSLTTPRAEAFVTYKTGPTPEQTLDVAKNAFLIEMDVEEKGVIKMQLSPPNKDGKIFATTSALPGDVFTLPDAFGWLRMKPTALKKD